VDLRDGDTSANRYVFDAVGFEVALDDFSLGTGLAKEEHFTVIDVGLGLGIHL
jgi:hypothetical protein